MNANRIHSSYKSGTSEYVIYELPNGSYELVLHGDTASATLYQSSDMAKIEAKIKEYRQKCIADGMPFVQVT